MASEKGDGAPAIRESGVLPQKGALADGDAHAAAERGYAATDQYGRSLIQFDRAAEARVRLKIDFYVVPTVSLIYLFCFIDRANIGILPPLSIEPSF